MLTYKPNPSDTLSYILFEVKVFKIKPSGAVIRQPVYQTTVSAQDDVGAQKAAIPLIRKVFGDVYVRWDYRMFGGWPQGTFNRAGKRYHVAITPDKSFYWI